MALGTLAALALQAGRYSDAMRLYTEAGDLGAYDTRDEALAAASDWVREVATHHSGVVLLRSMAPEHEVLPRLKLSVLSKADAAEIMRGF